VDSWYFGELTFTFYNFLHFNFLTNGSGFYGTNASHWIISEGLPVVFWSFLPLLIIGIYKSHKSLITISFIFAVAVINIPPHKEYRFLLPYFPQGVLIMCNSIYLFKKKWIYVLILLQLPIGIFLTFYHQAGPLDVIDWIRNNEVTSVGFFTMCHSTPYYSHVHRNITMDFLQCKPL
jgi:GPI mannosyltransferase 3